jgi:hypothetical protein
MKRLVTAGSCLPIPRTKDKCYLYADLAVNPKSNKVNHFLKIVDFYLASGRPEKFIVEPLLGSYEPDVFFKDKNNNSICVEIQLTAISHKKMQKKIDSFVKEYGKEHDSKIFVICSDYRYKTNIPKGFRLVCQGLPRETVLLR